MISKSRISPYIIYTSSINTKITPRLVVFQLVPSHHLSTNSLACTPLPVERDRRPCNGSSRKCFRWPSVGQLGPARSVPPTGAVAPPHTPRAMCVWEKNKGREIDYAAWRRRRRRFVAFARTLLFNRPLPSPLLKTDRKLLFLSGLQLPPHPDPDLAARRQGREAAGVGLARTSGGMPLPVSGLASFLCLSNST